MSDRKSHRPRGGDQRREGRPSPLTLAVDAASRFANAARSIYKGPELDLLEMNAIPYIKYQARIAISGQSSTKNPQDYADQKLALQVRPQSMLTQNSTESMLATLKGNARVTGGEPVLKPRTYHNGKDLEIVMAGTRYQIANLPDPSVLNLGNRTQIVEREHGEICCDGEMEYEKCGRKEEEAIRIELEFKNEEEAGKFFNKYAKTAEGYGLECNKDGVSINIDGPRGTMYLHFKLLSRYIHVKDNYATAERAKIIHKKERKSFPSLRGNPSIAKIRFANIINAQNYYWTMKNFMPHDHCIALRGKEVILTRNLYMSDYKSAVDLYNHLNTSASIDPKQMGILDVDYRTFEQEEPSEESAPASAKPAEPKPASTEPATQKTDEVSAPSTDHLIAEADRAKFLETITIHGWRDGLYPAGQKDAEFVVIQFGEDSPKAGALSQYIPKGLLGKSHTREVNAKKATVVRVNVEEGGTIELLLDFLDEQFPGLAERFDLKATLAKIGPKNQPRT